MNWIRRIVEGTLILMALSGVLFVRVWPMIIRNGIDASLRRHASSVRKAAIPIDDKERLLDLIESLQGQLATEKISLFQWAKHDQAFDEMEQGGIDFDEVRLIERELRRAKCSFQETQP